MPACWVFKVRSRVPIALMVASPSHLPVRLSQGAHTIVDARSRHLRPTPNYLATSAAIAQDMSASMNDFDHLVDVTLVCGGERIVAHKVSSGELFGAVYDATLAARHSHLLASLTTSASSPPAVASLPQCWVGSLPRASRWR